MSGQTIIDRFTAFISNVFKTNLEVFFEALKLSPNAQGYVSGSITELLLKRRLEELGFEVKRIREKWEGRKHPQHHGDFYLRKTSADAWFVLESKGVKSNSEKWHKLYNYTNLKRFLIGHADKITWIDQGANVETQITSWISAHLPKFQSEYADNLYEFEEVRDYQSSVTRRVTEKGTAIAALRGLTRDEINDRIKKRLLYVMSEVRVLETHFVSGTSGAGERTQATPSKDEFHILSVDIFLRYTQHKFLFANPKLLESSGSDANHLQQNYIMGFVFSDSEGPLLSLTEDWSEDFNEVYSTLKKEEGVDERHMQVDNRNVVIGVDQDE